MSAFSDLLKSYTDRCGVPIIMLAKQCGIDRTTLHKIISGERRPPDVDFVVKISRLLMLSAAEREKLTVQYDISLMGDELYRRRHNVRAMLQKLSYAAAKENDSSRPYIRSDPESYGDTYYADNKQDLMRALFSVITGELEKGLPICIITQPDDDFGRFMRFTYNYYKGSEIKHIFCLDNTHEKVEANDRNLEYFPRVFELSVMFKNYRPMYYYDRVDSHINDASLLPIMVVSENYMMRATNDLEAGLIIRKKNAVEFSQKQFEKLEKICYPFVERVRDIAGMLGSGSDYHDYSYTIDRQPSFILLCTEDMVRRRIHISDEQKAILIERMGSLQKRYVGRDYLSIFSAEGLRMFMHTGRIKGLSEYIYDTVPPEARLNFLRSLIEKTEAGIYNYRIISEEFSPDDMLRINIDDECTVHFVLRMGNGFVFMTVCEQSVKLAMNDYVSALIETGRIYSRERSLEVMRDILAETNRMVEEGILAPNSEETPKNE